MRFKFGFVLFAAVVCPVLFAQTAPDPPATWTWRVRAEVRGDYRWSAHDQIPLKFKFPNGFLPPGQTVGFEETPDPGSHVELNNAELQFDLGYGEWFVAHAKVHGQGLYRRNPTSSDRKFDADELFLRLGIKPEGLERPNSTSFFIQAGKAPKMERQPVRLLESYGLAATSFNRFEDIQLLVGGSVGRNLYWRLQAANGNPLFFRDPNAFAGDNGTPELLKPFPTPVYNSGFPILYNAESEGLAFRTDHVQIGEGLGYRWQRADQTLGFDAIAFHYRRGMAATEKLTGTFYGGDIDLLDEVAPQFPGTGLPITSRTKEEWGARIYTEWHAATTTTQFTKQRVAGFYREGWEIESGYRIDLPFRAIRSIQPVARASGLTNRFKGNAVLYPAPSIWWQWTKIDGGVRIGLPRGFDVTAEYSKHNVGAPKKLSLRETLVTVRWRV